MVLEKWSLTYCSQLNKLELLSVFNTKNDVSKVMSLPNLDKKYAYF